MSNDDYGPECNNGRASLRRTLAAGTYYVVSELYNPNSACRLITTISTTTAPTLTVTAQSTSLTAGNSTTLTASGATSYTWSPAAGLSSTTGTSVTATPARTTTYTATAVGQSGCPSAPASITIAVNTLPVAPNNPADDLNRNWALERTYDGNGNVMGESKQFADVLGRPTQAQVKSMTTRQVLATQTVYSSGGQPVLTTLPAPTNNQAFSYKDRFITAGGNLYSWTNFENQAEPAPVDATTTPGSVNYYYGEQNTLEPTTATTRYPFSLTEPYEGPLGGLKRAAGPGDELHLGKGHDVKARELPMLDELTHYLSWRKYFLPTTSGLSAEKPRLKIRQHRRQRAGEHCVCR